MSGNVWITSDTHLGHKLVAEARGFATTEEHDEFVLDSLSACVRSKRNVLWILGDVAFGRHNIEKLNRVPGVKKLVMGNHDHYPTSAYLEVFSKVLGSANLRGLLLTHIPVAEQQFWRFPANVHGHLHENTIDDSRYINVCLEQNGLRPFPLEQLLEAA